MMVEGCRAGEMSALLIYPEFPGTFWRFFFWALLRKPRLFPLAITFTMSGCHFRRVLDLPIH